MAASSSSVGCSPPLPPRRAHASHARQRLEDVQQPLLGLLTLRFGCSRAALAAEHVPQIDLAVGRPPTAVGRWRCRCVVVVLLLLLMATSNYLLEVDPIVLWMERFFILQGSNAI